MQNSHATQAGFDRASLCARLGVQIPELFLPNPETDLFRWAVVACDQFTSQPDYWEQVRQFVGAEPSTLDLVLPEIYLETPGNDPVSDRIERINQTMQHYLADGIIQPQLPGWMLVDRSTPLHPSRKGLLLAIDLEHYDFTPGNQELVRATEGTVLDRIPPRQAIRRDALLELPHVQLLIDDPQHSVIEPLFARSAVGQPLYETALMQGGGSVRGWLVPAATDWIDQALAALAALKSLQEFGLLFAVGDGNHSLATAKAHWNSIRSQESPTHPARFALAEVINIHDPGLDFEPIHRAVFGLDFASFMARAGAWLARQATALPLSAIVHPIPVLWAGERTVLNLRLAPETLPVAAVQDMLDAILAESGPDVRLDYIHGADVVENLAAEGHIGLLLPALAKDDFFAVIAHDGILPRKTFSMGEAFEKRYYFECRRIR